MNFIVFSGISESFNKAIISACLEKTNYRDYFVNRDPSNCMALNFIQDKIDTIEQMDEYIGFLNYFKEGVDLAVLITCDNEALEKRFADYNKIFTSNESFLERQEVIKQYFDKAKYQNCIEINATDKTVDQCVKLIINKLEE